MSTLRLEITKGEAVRYISHLDYARLMERALRRAKLPVAYSEGFNPHMKMAFASALSLGVTSDAEYMDIELSDDAGIESHVAALSRQLPSGVILKRTNLIDGRHKALSAIINIAVYKIAISGEFNSAAVAKSLDNFNKAGQVIYRKVSPKGNKDVDVKQYVVKDVSWSMVNGGLQLEMTIKITPTGSIKPSAVLAVLVDDFELSASPAAALITRSGLFVQNGGKVMSPLTAGIDGR